MDKGMKGVVSVQLCLEGQLESGVFPIRKWAGGMPESTGKSSLRLGFRQARIYHQAKKA